MGISVHFYLTVFYALQIVSLLQNAASIHLLSNYLRDCSLSLPILARSFPPIKISLAEHSRSGIPSPDIQDFISRRLEAPCAFRIRPLHPGLPTLLRSNQNMVPRPHSSLPLNIQIPNITLSLEVPEFLKLCPFHYLNQLPQETSLTTVICSNPHKSPHTWFVPMPGLFPLLKTFLCALWNISQTSPKYLPAYNPYSSFLNFLCLTETWRGHCPSVLSKGLLL
jgi:hypothetical protein